MICGHYRETWILALHHWNASSERAENIASEVHPRDELCSAIKDLTDPSKLAAIVAELMSERGLSVKTDPQYDCQWLVFADEYDAVSIVAPRFAKAITMPQARALALALLDAPNASVQDVERMIGEL
jgi:hypothetical protein